MGSISFGWLFVAGRKRVPSPAAGMTAFVTAGFGVTRRRYRRRRPAESVLLAPHQAAQVREVARHDERGEGSGDRDVEQRPVEPQDDEWERDRAQHRRHRRLVEPAGDREPHHAEDDRLEGEHDQHDPRPGRDAPPALELTRDREDVADDGGHAEDERASVPVEGQARPGRQRALADVEHQDDQARLPAQDPEGVRRPRVPGALAGDVVPAGSGHQPGAREAAKQIRDRQEAEDHDHRRILPAAAPRRG